ncbi:MAG: hypothetical protein BroJett040_20400 [Oligoflexia bacterium]|nr:MAG: hypothetical protein BroJett040_20400 [Oligoflexia bacterium]
MYSLYLAVSFCSKEEKPLLEDIQTLINKKIDVINVSKGDYEIIAQPIEQSMSLEALLEFEEKRKKSKHRKKKKKLARNSSLGIFLDIRGEVLSG